MTGLHEADATHPRVREVPNDDETAAQVPTETLLQPYGEIRAGLAGAEDDEPVDLREIVGMPRHRQLVARDRHAAAEPDAGRQGGESLFDQVQREGAQLLLAVIDETGTVPYPHGSCRCHLNPLSARAPVGPSGVDGCVPELFFDLQEPVVLGRPLAANRRPGLDLSRVQGDDQV